jgi:tripartite-type tricarboxylate transporter receptor subunit TctC
MPLRSLLAAILLVLATSVAAQPYPAKPVKVIVPWPPAGVSDILARTLAQALTETSGQQFIVENKPGAGGTLGMAQVAKSPPDGYTLAASDIPSHAISASLYAKLPYDVLADFEPVAVIAGSPMVLVTQPSLNARSVADFIRLAKSKPGMAYGSSGNGSITHLAIERMKQETGIDLQHVPFKGTVGAVASVMAGDTVLAFGTIPGTVPHAKAGKLVLLGSSFAKRFSQIPEVAPVADTLPGFDMGFYTALFAPAGTPRDIVQRIYAETAKAFANAKLKEIYAVSAAEPGTMSSAELKAYMTAEVKNWGDVVRKVGLKID